MASTRSKNTPGNYAAERWSNNQDLLYRSYEHSGNGRPIESMFSGDGLLMGRMVPTELSTNSVDIESFLYGVGSTNLVNPKGETYASLKPLKSLSVINRIPLIMPNNLAIEPFQRPLNS
jgi:hypothetical protein